MDPFEPIRARPSSPAAHALHTLFAQPRVLPVSASEVVRIGGLFDTLAAESSAPGTPARLNRLVRAEAGRCALEVVNDRLAREAFRCVVYVAAPISQLAFELGFDGPAYFCRFFKRQTGLSPRAYRQQRSTG